MPRFSKKIAIVLGICAAVALANSSNNNNNNNDNDNNNAPPALAIVPGQGRVDHDTGLICRFGGCYSKYFVPTNEFKQILPDQVIPPGLHVKMDFETGEKFAKLMDKTEDNQDSDNAAVLVVDTENPGVITHDLGIDYDSSDNTIHPESGIKESEETFSSSQIEIESQRKLQTVFDSIPEFGSPQKNDQQINDEQEAKYMGCTKPYCANEPQLFDERLDIIKNSKDNESVLAALDMLSDQVRYLDHGVRLIKGEGLQALLKRLDCDSQDQSECEKTQLIRTTAAMAIGAALQNNKEAQLAGFKANLHKTLLARSEVESDPKLLRQIIGAYGDLIRCSVRDYLSDEDVSRFAQLLKNSDDMKVQYRIVTIMTDFADPDMQEIIVDEESESVNSTGPIVPITKAVAKKVNVGPWCDTLQQVKEPELDEYIEDALEFLQVSYPETCIVSKKNIKDEL